MQNNQNTFCLRRTVFSAECVPFLAPTCPIIPSVMYIFFISSVLRLNSPSFVTDLHPIRASMTRVMSLRSHKTHYSTVFLYYRCTLRKKEKSVGFPFKAKWMNNLCTHVFFFLFSYKTVLCINTSLQLALCAQCSDGRASLSVIWQPLRVRV